MGQSTPIDDLGTRIINNKVGVHQSKCVLTTIPSPARRSTLERASSTSAVIPRSSASRMERPNPSSSNARTPAELPGLSCSADNTRRVSLRKLPRSDPAVPSSQRAIVGASLEVIKERRSQRPEARSAARQAAIKEGKEKRAAAQSAKKAEKAKNAAGAAKGNARVTSK